jgi:hypothetical protein
VLTLREARVSDVTAFISRSTASAAPESYVRFPEQPPDTGRRLVDEIDVSIAPLILGGGAGLFEGLRRGTLKLRQIRAVDAPGVTHIKYEAH